MVLIAKLPTISAFAWAPFHTAHPLLVTGSASGAMDENFSNDAQLIIWAVERGNAEQNVSVTTNARFNRVAWSMPTATYKKGLIATGAENGEVGLWDASLLLDGNVNNNALIHTSNVHKGPVRGLEFSPVDPTLLASGGPNGEIFVYDTKDTSFKPRAPGPVSGKLSDISCISWNRRLAYILAASSNNGQTVVWDLRNKREASCLSYSGHEGTVAGPQSSGRRSVSSVLWHPENATRLATASDDDSCPVIMLWDLRNAHAPEKILVGHTKGILDLAWCLQDPDLLLSCGKDNRTLCWNPTSGEIVAEAQQNSNWTFQVDWSISNSNLYANASFDGSLSILTLQSTEGPAQPIPSRSFANDGADLFDGPILSTDSNNNSLKSLSQAPRWLRRPVSASFGFGGRLVTFNNSAKDTAGKNTFSSVNVQTIADEPSFRDRAIRLHDAVQSKSLAEFTKKQLETNNSEDWKTLQTLFQENSRDELISLLGFSKSDINSQISNFLAQRKPEIHEEASVVETDLSHQERAVSPAVTDQEEIDSMIDVDAINLEAENTPIPFSPASAVPDDDFFNHLPPLVHTKGVIPPHISIPHIQQSSAISVAATAGSRAPSPVIERHVDVSFQIYPSNESETDRILTRALIIGDFDSAVSLCLETKRFADALVIASKGGPKLFQKAQTAYFQQNLHEVPFLRLCQAITANDLTDIVHNANLADWKDIFAVICTFAKGSEFSFLTEQLGKRLQLSFRLAEDTQTTVGQVEIKQDRANAIICYLAAQNLEQLVAIWSDQMEEQIVQSAGAEAHSDLTSRAMALQSFVEKVTVFKLATNYVDQDYSSQPIDKDYKLSRLYDLYFEYSGLLASQGRLDISTDFIAQIPANYTNHQLSPIHFDLMRNRLKSPSVTQQEFAPSNPIQVVQNLGSTIHPSIQTSYQHMIAQNPKPQNTSSSAHSDRYVQHSESRPPSVHVNPDQRTLMQGQSFATNFTVPQQSVLPNSATFRSPPLPSVAPPMPPKKATGGWNDAPISQKVTPVLGPKRTGSSIVSSPFPHSGSGSTSPNLFNPQPTSDIQSGNLGFQVQPPNIKVNRVMQAPLNQGISAQEQSQTNFGNLQGRPQYQDGNHSDLKPTNSLQNANLVTPSSQGFAVPVPVQNNNIYTQRMGEDQEGQNFNVPALMKPVTGPKYPLGDRTHIDPGSLPIFEVLNSELIRFQSTCPNAQRRQADDCAKRLNGLFDAMNCDVLEASVIAQLHGIARALSLHDPAQAASAHVHLITTYNGRLPQFLGWVQGIKPLISRQTAELAGQ